MNETAPDSPSDPVGLRATALEIAVVVLAFWLPNFLASADSFLSFPAQISYAGHVLAPAYLTSLRIGECAAIALLMWKGGEGLARYGLTRFRLVDIAWAFVVLLALGLLAWLGSPSISFLSHFPGGHLAYSLGRGMGAAGLPLFITAAVLYEEVLFRSYLCTRLADLGWSRLRVVVATSLLFAVPHIYQGWSVLPVTFVFGAILALAFLRLRSIWPGYLAHLAYDVILVAPYVWHRIVNGT